MVPENIKSIIRQKASSEWPGDYSMQSHVIEEQTQAYLKLEMYHTNLDTDNELFIKSMNKAVADWPKDYNMQIYTFESQVHAASEFFDATYAGVPDYVVEEIRAKAFTEWPDDYEMMLYTLNEQVGAWQTIYG